MRVAPGRWRAGCLAALAGLTVVMAALVAPAGADPGPAPPSRQRVILNDIHTDVMDVQYVDGQLRLRTRVGEPPFQFFSASEVLFQLKDIDQVSRHPIPDDPRYAFLGPAATPVWLAPEFTIDGLIWPGWDAESIPLGVLAGDTVDLRLVSATGPGAVEIFRSDTAGLPVRFFSSRDPGVRTVRQPVGGAGHTHSNWAFTALGRYELTFEATGTDISGRALSSGPVTYTWYVGGTQASDVVVPASVTTLAASPPSSSVGQPVTLTGSLAPAHAPGWIEFHDGDTVLGHAAVSGGQAVLTTSALGPGQHQLTARFVPADRTDFQPSTSLPLTYQVSGNGSTTAPTTPTTGPTTTTVTSSAPSSTTAPTSSTAPPESTTPTTMTTSCVTTRQQPAPPGAVVLDDGHVDYAARITGGVLSSQIKDGTGTTPVWREPSRVVFHVVPAAATTVPANPAFAFLGRPGDTVWQIPHFQRDGIVWLGWNTEEITAAQVPGGITWSLDRVEGPGQLAVYQLNSFGQPQVVFNGGDGVPDRYEVARGTHAHANWAFTREGVYRVTFTHTATLASGTQVRDTEVVTFAVGAVDPRTALPATESPSTSSTTGTCPAGTNPARLADTGSDVRGPLAVGGLLVLAGGLTVVAVRRRYGVSDVDGLVTRPGRRR